RLRAYGALLAEALARRDRAEARIPREDGLTRTASSCALARPEGPVHAAAGDPPTADERKGARVCAPLLRQVGHFVPASRRVAAAVRLRPGVAPPVVARRDRPLRRALSRR